MEERMGGEGKGRKRMGCKGEEGRKGKERRKEGMRRETSHFKMP